MPKHIWNKINDILLIELYEKTTVKYCANFFSVSESIIKNNARRLKLKIRKGIKHVWTVSEDAYLIDNYPLYGMSICAKHLGLSKIQIKNRCTKLGLVLNEIYKINLNNSKININNFLNVTDPKIAYFLGLFWADGYITKPDTHHHKKSKITLLETDMNVLCDVFTSVGNWNTFRIDRTKNNSNLKPYIELSTTNILLYEFLVKFKYHQKSNISMDGIFHHIPEHLRCYFLLGLIDGDGCVYYTPRHCNRISIASSFNYDWSCIESIFQSLDIKYSIQRRIHTIGRSSSIIIYRLDSIKKLISYLWPNKYEFGLKRKYDKAQQILINKHLL